MPQAGLGSDESCPNRPAQLQDVRLGFATRARPSAMTETRCSEALCGTFWAVRHTLGP